MNKIIIFYKYATKMIIIFYIQYIFFKNSKFHIKNDANLLFNKNEKQLNTIYYLSDIFNESKIIFNITSIIYSFSFKFNITKVEYNILFYDEKHNLIIPSDLALYHQLHIFCIITETDKNITIISLANIYNNKYFNCIEFENLRNRFNFGIKIYKINKSITNYISINCFNEQIINFNSYIYQNNSEYNPLIIRNKKKSKTGNSNKLLFYDSPIYCIKSKISKKYSKWYFKNIYNHYFCFCKFYGNKCLYENIPKECKYMFYLYIIDNHKFIFNKTDYLLADFSSPFNAPGESYYVFKEMIKQNLSAHYMTKRKDLFKIYSNYNNDKKNKLPLIYFEFIDGDFLEKYLDLFLKLKSVISGANIKSMNNLFKQIQFITFISLGHGISYLKDFLYKNYYGIRKYDKILLPPSNIIISNAKKYGWTNNKIIKIGLPRWDLFYEYDNQILNNKNLVEQSIFVMFTWRVFKNKQIISKYYFKNIAKLINDQNLHELLKLKNIILHFALHDNFAKYKSLFKINKYINYISQINIINCLKRSSLVITDFSSIIFDFIVRKKPYIIFIPDAEDSKIKSIYNKDYYDVINRMINGSLDFENKYFKVNETIKKIKFYINNNFKLDRNLDKFYLKFNFRNKGNNIQLFINYLKNLK